MSKPQRNYSPLFALERIANTQIKSAITPFDFVYVKDENKDEIEVIAYQLISTQNLLTKYGFKDIEEVDKFLFEHLPMINEKGKWRKANDNE